jgi:hypothetical protein
VIRKLILVLAVMAAAVVAVPVPAGAATLGQCQTTFAPRPVLHPAGWDNVMGQVRVKCSHHPRSFLLGEWVQFRHNGTWQYEHGVLHENAPGTTYLAYHVQAECRTGLWRTIVHASTTDGAGYHQVSLTSGAIYVAHCPPASV